MNKLRQYQIEDVERMYEQMNTLNANDMGLGKTIESIALCNKICASKVLIVCPSTLMFNWLEEINDWSNLPNNDAIIVTGSKEKREKLLMTDATYYIVNKEMVRDPSKFPMLFKRKWDVVIVDEIHQFKNRKTSQFKGLKRLKTDYKIGLTGNPMDKEPENSWSILNWLNPSKYSSFWQFVEKYCNLQNSYYNPRAREIIGINSAKEAELQAELQEIMIRHLKKDVCSQIPPKIRTTIHLELTPEQRRLYKSAEQDMYVYYNKSEVLNLGDVERFLDCDDIVVQKYSTILERDMRLRQICLTPELLGGKALSAKIDAVLLLIADRSGPICIFSMYAKFIKILEREIISKLNIVPAKIIGEKSLTKKADNIDAFRIGKTEVFLGTIPAAGTGIDGLQVANTLVFADKDFRHKVNDQVEDRIHRIGQENAVQIISLVCKDTIEERIEKVLAQRSSVIDKLIIDNETFDEIYLKK